MVWLRDQQLVEIDAQSLRIGGIEGMLCVHERRVATQCLSLRDHL